MGKKKIDEDDFPVKTDKEQIKSRDNEEIATAESEEIANDLAERLNDDAWLRHEDNWSP